MDAGVIFGVAAALLGAIAGSFINAASFRYNTGRSLLWARSTGLRASRSRCMHCGHTLGALDLVPVFSYLLLRGRCRYCGSRVSLQYPFVEAAAAALGLLTYLTHPAPVAFGFWFLVWMLLLFIFIYDLRHKIIPWGTSGSLAAAGLLGVWLWQGVSSEALLAGPVLAAPLLFFSLVSRGEWMGWGDGALELGLGWLLGLTMGLTALMFAFWVGAGVGIALILSSRAVTMKSEVPFAPFLILGAAVAHFCNVDLFSTLYVFF